MPETGLVVVADGPIESIYALAPNGLFLPPHVTPTPALWVAQNPYPEFAQALVQELDKHKYGGHPFAKPKLAYHASPVKMAKLQSMSDELLLPPGKRQKTILDVVPGLNTNITLCPTGQCDERIDRNTTVQGMIVHLNDGHHWSRERIAKWLDTLTDIDLRVRKVEYAQN